jgi:hypothetical protein
MAGGISAKKVAREPQSGSRENQMSLSTAKDILMITVTISFAGLIIVNAVLLYIAKTKIESILNSLQNSSIASSLLMLWHGGLWGRIYMMGEVFGILRNPATYIYQGKLSAKDIKNFPQPKTHTTYIT